MQGTHPNCLWQKAVKSTQPPPFPGEANHKSHTPKGQCQEFCCPQKGFSFLQSRPGLRADKPTNNRSSHEQRWQKSFKFNSVNNCSIWGWNLVCPRMPMSTEMLQFRFPYGNQISPHWLYSNHHLFQQFYFPLALCHWRHSMKQLDIKIILKEFLKIYYWSIFSVFSPPSFQFSSFAAQSEHGPAHTSKWLWQVLLLPDDFTFGVKGGS